MALVTGGASGLGLGAAKRLVDGGASVALLDVNTARGEEAAATFTEGLSARIRNGEFSVEQPRQ